MNEQIPLLELLDTKDSSKLNQENQTLLYHVVRAQALTTYLRDKAPTQHSYFRSC